MKPILTFFIVLFLGSFTNDKIVLDIQTIRFGSGGGLTGEINSYELSREGQLTAIHSGDTTFLKTVPQDQIKEILKTAESIKEIKLNEPGNMYRFIEIDYDKGTTIRLVWGFEYQNLPSEIDAFYKKLEYLTN
jgi:hypothetical protein